MMFYTSKLVSDAAEKQEKAVNHSLGFAEPLLHAMALADHFEKIQPEEYVIPETNGFSKPFGLDRQIRTECYTAL